MKEFDEKDILTEDDVVRMTQEVEESIKIDPQFEKEWLLKEIAANRKVESELALAFRVWRKLRNDKEIKNTYNNLARTRQAINVLQERLDNLLKNL